MAKEKFYELPTNLHPLAELLGLKPRIRTSTYETTLFVEEGENPKKGSVFKGFKVTKEVYTEDEELVIGAMKHHACVDGGPYAGWVSAPSEEEAIAGVPKAFLAWASEKKHKAIADIASLKEKIETNESFVERLKSDVIPAPSHQNCCWNVNIIWNCNTGV